MVYGANFKGHLVIKDVPVFVWAGVTEQDYE